MFRIRQARERRRDLRARQVTRDLEKEQSKKEQDEIADRIRLVHEATDRRLRYMPDQADSEGVTYSDLDHTSLDILEFYTLSKEGKWIKETLAKSSTSESVPAQSQLDAFDIPT